MKRKELREVNKLGLHTVIGSISKTALGGWEVWIRYGLANLTCIRIKVVGRTRLRQEKMWNAAIREKMKVKK